MKEVIARRLERLSERGRQLAAVGATVGRDFEFPLLWHASRLAQHEAAQALEELVRRRILHAIGDRFDFTHDRIREVVFEKTLGPHRRLLHRQVAEAIEHLYVANLEPHTLALGIHYREAQAWERALDFFRRAGDLAFMRSANREAVACFEEALEALDHLPQTRESLEQAVDLRFRLRNALWPLGDLPNVLRRLREAQSLGDALDDRCRTGWSFSYMAQYAWMTGEQDHAIEHGREALEIATTLGDVGLRVAANLHLGIAYHALGDYRQSAGILARNVDTLRGESACERFGLAALPSVYSRTWIAWSLAELGEFNEGYARAEEAIEIAERYDQPLSLINAYLGLGLLSLQWGELTKSVPVLEQALALSRAREFILWLPYSAAFLGWSYVLSERPAEGLALLEGAVEQAAAKGLMVNQAPRIAWLGEAHLAAGRTEDALRLASSARDLARRCKERGHEAWALRLLGDIGSHGTPPARERAGDHYFQAAAIARELGMRPLVAHCHLGLGKLYSGTGKPSESTEHLAAAVAMYREMGMSLWLERANAAMSVRPETFPETTQA